MNNIHALGFWFVLPLLILSSCRTAQKPTSTYSKITKEHSDKIFQKVVRPVLEHRCIHCHNHKKPLAGLNFQNRETVFNDNPLGPFLVAGSPEKSRIWKAINHPEAHPRVMPGDGWGLTTEKKKAFKAWIESGAYWPEGHQGHLRVKPYQVEIEGYL